MIVLVVGVTLSGGWTSSVLTQSLEETLPKASEADIARVHDPASLRADLDALVSLHERTCPNPYLRTSREAIRDLADRLAAAIDRPLTRREFLPIVMRLQAAYASDHLGQAVPREDLEAAFARGERLLPFRAEPIGGELVVVAVSEGESAVEPGDRIVRVGRFSGAEHLERLRELVPAESSHAQGAAIGNAYRSLAWAAGIELPTEGEFARADGTTHAVSVTGVAAGARRNERTLSDPSTQPGPAAPSGEVLVENPPFRCLLLDSPAPAAGPRVAFIDFPTMDAGRIDQWRTFLEDAMAAIEQRRCVGLIVDIRRNGGGDSRLGRMLLARLTDRPYRLASRIEWRRSAESDEMMRLRVKPWGRWLLPIALPLFVPGYARLEPGEDCVIENAPEVSALVEPSFRGPACLLIGGGTHSSAMQLADGARTYDLMRTVGEPTGGIPNSLGEVGSTQLPNTKVRVRFCQKEFRRASGDGGDLGPVLPHIEVAAVPDGDAALERAIVEVLRMAAQPDAAGRDTGG